MPHEAPNQEPNSHIEPLVPPTPIVTDTEAGDGTEYPLGARFTLEEWRHAARYQSFVRRCYTYMSVACCYYVCPLMLGFAPVFFPGCLLPNALFITIGCVGVISIFAVWLIPSPLKVALAFLCLFGSGIGFMLIGLFVTFNGNATIREVDKVILFQLVFFGFSFITYGIELYTDYQKLQTPLPPSPDLENQLVGYVRMLRQPRKADKDEFIEFSGWFNAWIWSIQWRVLLFEGYALIAMKSGSRIYFVRREEFSLRVTDVCAFGPRRKIAINIATERPMTGTIHPLDWDRYQQWFAQHPSVQSVDN